MADLPLQVCRCIIALHDLGSREGATTASVMKQLKLDGFTPSEISAAVEHMTPTPTSTERNSRDGSR